jgi:non-ribosomal peptide synthetase component F
MLILAQENSRVTPDKNFEEFSLTEIEQSVPQRFEKQVDKYPNSLAIKDRDQALTYRELNEFANQIAHGILKVWMGKLFLLQVLKLSPLTIFK